MLRQATITSKTANAIAVANAAMIVANKRTYLTPYPNARNTIVPVDGKRPQPVVGQGQLAERIVGQFGPFRSALRVGPNIP
jgi:hypothetical protein